MLEALGNLFYVTNDPDVMMIVLVAIIFLLFIGVIMTSMNRKSSEPFENENKEQHENQHRRRNEEQQVANDLEAAVLKTRDFLESHKKDLNGPEVSSELLAAINAVNELHGRENLEQHLDPAMDKHNIPHELIDPIVLGHKH